MTCILLSKLMEIPRKRKHTKILSRCKKFKNEQTNLTCQDYTRYPSRNGTSFWIHTLDREKILFCKPILIEFTELEKA